MQISKLSPLVCAAVVCASFVSVRAQDTPAQAAARAALQRKMNELDAQEASTNAKAATPPAAARQTIPPATVTTSPPAKAAAVVAAPAVVPAAKPAASTPAKIQPQTTPPGAKPVVAETKPAKPVVPEQKPKPARNCADSVRCSTHGDGSCRRQNPATTSQARCPTSRGRGTTRETGGSGIKTQTRASRGDFACRSTSVKSPATGNEAIHCSASDECRRRQNPATAGQARCQTRCGREKPVKPVVTKPKPQPAPVVVTSPAVPPPSNVQPTPPAAPAPAPSPAAPPPPPVAPSNPPVPAVTTPAAAPVIPPVAPPPAAPPVTPVPVAATPEAAVPTTPPAPAAVAQEPAKPVVPEVKPAVTIPAKPAAVFPGKELGMKPIEVPALPISAAKEARLRRCSPNTRPIRSRRRNITNSARKFWPGHKTAFFIRPPGCAPPAGFFL